MPSEEPCDRHKKGVLNYERNGHEAGAVRKVYVFVKTQEAAGRAETS